jgi:hypothetical protein
MSEGEFHAYVGLLVVSALVLSVLAVRGFGQSTGARIGDGIFAVIFFGYALYLIIVSPDTVHIFLYAFAAPVVAVSYAWRSRGQGNATRQTAGIPPGPYAATPGPAASHGFPPQGFPPQGFPPPPPPLDAQFTPPADPSRAGPPDRSRRRAMASGLPTAMPGPAGSPGSDGTSGPAGIPSGMPPAAGMPSGMPGPTGQAPSGMPWPAPSGMPPSAGRAPTGMPEDTPGMAPGRGPTPSGLPAGRTDTDADMGTRYPSRPSGLPGHTAEEAWASAPPAAPGGNPQHGQDALGPSEWGHHEPDHRWSSHSESGHSQDGPRHGRGPDALDEPPWYGEAGPGHAAAEPGHRSIATPAPYVYDSPGPGYDSPGPGYAEPPTVSAYDPTADGPPSDYGTAATRSRTYAEWPSPEDQYGWHQHFEPPAAGRHQRPEPGAPTEH